MPRTIPCARYVFKRLQELNCHSIHGVPGDFFLRALDHLRPAASSGPRWIGNASELCAGYAADGYARAATQIARHRSLPFAPTIGAVFTTYGVGELSVINAIAGSYAESIPVVHLVGTPSRKAMARGDPGRPIHHSLADGNMEIWAEMAKNVTCAQAYLHKHDSGVAAAEVLDDVLEQAISKSKPVYASIPSDLVDAEVPADMLHKSLKLEPPPNDPKLEDTLVEQLVSKMKTAKFPLIVADSLSYPLQLSQEINSLVEMTRIKAMSYMSGKGIIEEWSPSWDPSLPNTTEQSRNADLVIYFGPLLADTNTARWSAIPECEDNVLFNLDTVQMNGQSYPLRSKPVLQKLVQRLKQDTFALGDDSLDNPDGDSMRLQSRSAGDKISQDDFWKTMSGWLRTGDTILLANGTPLIGGRALQLPDHGSVVASSIWCSIGHMLPAAQGMAAAKADHGLGGRTILFEGDGSFQVTCQSISDFIRNGLDATIFLVNNKGYTYERWLNGMKAGYNDVPDWNYGEAARFFGGGGHAFTSERIETMEQLLTVCEDEYYNSESGLRIYDIVLDPGDVPEKSKPGLRNASEALRSS